MPIWTPAQRLAIEARGCNLLVAAAAGSGKTAVLVERILALLREGEPLQEMLMVTFTRAAATEMRGRILYALQEAAAKGDLVLGRQAAWVERAEIRTLHGFCQSVLRRHFQAAGVDPSFRVADEGQVRVLAEQAMEEALIRCYEEATPGFEALAACLEPWEIAEWAREVYGFMRARPDPWVWLRRAVEGLPVRAEDVAGSEAMAVLLRRAERGARAALETARELVRTAEEGPLPEKFVQSAQVDAELCERVVGALGHGLAALREIAGGIKFATRPSVRDPELKPFVEGYAGIRDQIKEGLLKACDLEFLCMDPALHAEDARILQAQLEGLETLLRQYEEIFDQQKEALGLLDFSDLEQRALVALGDPGVAEAMRRRYRHIFVDEYQDSSPLQEALMERICRPDNLFLVGDVKQSIYRFRQADPRLFLARYGRYPEEPGHVDRLVNLNTNFRSYNNVLHGINRVFGQIMREDLLEIEYDDRAALHPGLAPKDESPAVEVHLLSEEGVREEELVAEDVAIDSEEDVQDLQGIEGEALWISRRILELRGQPGIKDKPLRFRDMVILLRAPRGRGSRMVEILRSQGVPAWSDIGDGFFDQLEVAQMLDILRVLDNPHQDEALMGALRGPALGLEEEALATIRLAKPKGREPFYEAAEAAAGGRDDLALALQGFYRRMDHWAYLARIQPLHLLIHRIYEETDFLALVGALPGGRARQANLRLLAQEAERFQKNQMGGLSAFVRHVKKVRNSGDTQSATDIGEADDVVRILSMHKSKGLQFPVVILAGLGQRFNNKERTKAILCQEELGIGAFAYDADLGTRRNTLNREAVLEVQGAGDRAEEARVLYVAMTRAEKHLLLYGSSKKLEENLHRWSKAHTEQSILGARSNLDWILPCVLTHPDGEALRRAYDLPELPLIPDESRWEIQVHALPQAPSLEGGQGLEAFLSRLQASPGSAQAEARLFAPLPVELLPFKESVSQRIRQEQRSQTLSKRPLCLQETAQALTGAERGDAVHAILALVDLSDLRKAQDLCSLLEFTLVQAVARGILSPAQGEAVSIRQLAAFYQGSVGQRLLKSPKVQREWPFNLRIMQDSGEILVQGVVDCCFWEEDGWILLDYKTDRVRDLDQILDNYRPQLEEYAKALVAITGQPVKERLLYLFEMGRAYAL